MKDQIIITLGREHGSGGHYIADMIARELGIKLYDKDSIESEIVSEGYSEALIRRMDEKPVNFFASRRIGRFSNSLEVNVAEKTFDMIRAKAASGESFLLIGRCGEQVLKDDRLIVEGVQPIETYDPGKNFGMNRVERVKRETSGGGAAGYFLTVPSRDSAQMHKVENLLCNIFDGGTVRVYFRFQDTGRAMLARHMAVKDDPLLRAELERILGKDCVKVQDVEHSAK